ncbi:MAG: phosphatase PAP2 family protein [Flavobacteriales bacterium]|nr:phosphatase PAP2 family protein [Flavobacteriales bacterium]|tara:strand:+ start:21574 stop:22152 length:579 start_codon:yes stop_codon:yes gene_type:complete
MIEAILDFDQELFLALNRLNSGFMDSIMVFISGKLEWIPLYVILLYFVYKKYGKHTWIILIGAALTVTLADQISVQLFKNVFERLRPCHNPDINEMVHIVNNKCGGQFGFVSSHATNTFAIATFLGLLLKGAKKKTTLVLLLIWAAIVSYSRIYLGVHYPLDVLCGGILGVGIGYFVYRLSKYFILKRTQST